MIRINLLPFRAARKKENVRRQISLFLLSLAFLLVVSGSAVAKEIKVLSQFPMSGPVGSLPEFGWGYIDGMNWVNGEGGGVNGKKITWYMEDFRYNPTVEVANFNRSNRLSSAGVDSACNNDLILLNIGFYDSW